MGTGAVTRNAFFAPGTLVGAARAAGGTAQPRTVTFVSNAGGVEAGNTSSDAVEAKIKKSTAELKTIVLARGSHLMDLHGVGPVVAARILAARILPAGVRDRRRVR